jgi:AcrR family transcriptional regulator
MSNASQNRDSVRERKRRETRERIVENGLKLFMKDGYDRTTLEVIAAASKISRRTFFYYFKSKEDVLLAQYEGLLEALRIEVIAQPIDLGPFETAKKCLLKLAARFVTNEALEIDRVMQSTEVFRNRKEAFYIELEKTLSAALSESWVSKADQPSLKMIAMIVIGTARISQESWRQEDGKHSLTYHLKKNFELLKHIYPT